MGQRVFIPTNNAQDDARVIFLAGPIQGAPDWQTDAINLLLPYLNGAVIASPRRVVAPKDFVYKDQVNWETRHLKLAGKSGVIIFWLAKEEVSLFGQVNGVIKLLLSMLKGDKYINRAYAQTTRAELFEWKERHITQGAKLAVGIEPGFTGERYVRMRLSEDCPDIVIANTLDATCRQAISLL